jgi:excisionase family DNA binding protein
MHDVRVAFAEAYLTRSSIRIPFRPRIAPTCARSSASAASFARTNARAATPEDKARLQEVEQLLCGEKLMSVSAVARMLGVSSPTTIHNWLEKGYFPGAVRTAGRQRRFRLADVLAVQEQIRQTETRNASGHLEFPDFGDEDPYSGR